MEGRLDLKVTKGLGAADVRVLIVSQYFHPENFRINQLALCLKERGHDVVVLTGLPNYPAGEFAQGYGLMGPYRETYQGIDVIRVPLYPRKQGKLTQLLLNYSVFIPSALLLGLPRLRGRFDVCICWATSPVLSVIPGLIYRTLFGTPAAIWIQDLWPETFFSVTRSKSRFLSGSLSAVVRWIYKFSDQIWIQSEAYHESVSAHGGRKDQVQFVPNWAEDLYDSSRWSDIVPDSLPENSLVFAGNLGRAQGLENLLAAAEITHREKLAVNWVVVGDGTLREWIHQEIKRRGLQGHVHMLPRRPASEMPQLLKAAAAVLVTLGEGEVYKKTIPSKVQSGFASGRPIIAALDGEPARLVREADCGFVVEPDQPSQLARAVKDFLKLSDVEKTRMGSSGHRMYKTVFTQERIVNQIDQLLKKMAAK